MKAYFTSKYWKGQRLLLLVFLLVHVTLAAIHVSQQSITFDEEDYYTYSVRWLQGKVERTDKMYDSKSPFTVVSAIPRIVKQIADPGYKATDFGHNDLLNGRYFMVIYTIIIALYLFKLIRKQFGEKAWILPLLFFLFEPSVLGYSMIITSDMASGACLLATIFHLYAFYENRNKKQFLFFSLWLGLGFVCKSSLLFLLPYIVLLLVVLLVTKKIPFNLKKICVYGMAMMLLSIAVINLAYFGKDSLKPLENSQFKSEVFKNLSQTPFIKSLPIPLPHNYIDALDLLQYHKQIGAGTPESSYPGVTIGDETKYKGGFWYYYLYTGLFKIPIAILIVLVIGAPSLSFKKMNSINGHRWFIMPAIFFLIVLSLVNPFQLGFRHFLLVYPLLFVAIAAGMHSFTRKPGFRNISFALLAYMLFSAGFYFPHLLSYTNEFIIDKSKAFHKLKDGSLDYGQNTASYQNFIINNPDYNIPPSFPLPGKYIVKASKLQDHMLLEDHSWLNSYAPVGHYQFSMFLFHVTEADIAKQKGRQ